MLMFSWAEIKIEILQWPVLLISKENNWNEIKLGQNSEIKMATFGADPKRNKLKKKKKKNMIFIKQKTTKIYY